MSTLAINPGFTRSRVRPAAPARRVAAPRPVAPARRPSAPVASRPRPRPAVASAAVRPAPVRLTRRGRVVVVLLMLGLLLAALTVFGPHSAATGDAGRPVPTRTVEVGQGDTLWNIAATVAEPGQTRAMVHQIEELNALTGPSLVEGQQIAVPVG